MIEDMNLPNQVIRSHYREASSSNTSFHPVYGNGDQ
jgi:hypothetical protein